MKQALILALLGVTLSACHAQTPQADKQANPHKQEQTMAAPNPQTVRLNINGQGFDLQLENNPTAQSFANLLPLDLAMDDHLNNEKFATLPKHLPRSDQTAGRISAGDVMLYQGDTLVIFYESFDSQYRYTKIGTLTNTDGLKSALGRGTVQIKWSR